MLNEKEESHKNKKKKKKHLPRAVPISPVEYDNIKRENETTQTPITSLPASFVPAPFGYQNSAPTGALRGFTKVSQTYPSEYWDDKLTENSINKKDRDKGLGKVVDATKMPDKYILEMVADWCAMSEEKGTNTPREWADDNIGKRWKFNDSQKDLIYEAIDLIWDKGGKKMAKRFTKMSEIDSKHLTFVQSPSSKNLSLVYYKDKFVGTILNKEKEDFWGHTEDNWGHSPNKFGPWTFGFSDQFEAAKALLSTRETTAQITITKEDMQNMQKELGKDPQNIEDLFRPSLEAYQKGSTSPKVLHDVQMYVELSRQIALDELKKKAQAQPGAFLVSPSVQSLIDSPRVEIEPTIKAEIQDAVEHLTASDPNYFKGISKIVALHSGPYGQVSSTDPSVIHLNVQRIKNDIKQHLGANFDQNNADHREMFEEAVKKAIVEVVSHERGHVLDWDPEKGFPGGEGVAEQESRRTMQKLFPSATIRSFITKTSRDIYPASPKMLFQEFVTLWDKYRSKVLADYEKKGKDTDKIDWENVMIDGWEKYTNDVQEQLKAEGWDEEQIDSYIEKLDDLVHIELEKYEKHPRSGSLSTTIRGFAKQANETLTYGIDIDGTIADLTGLLIEITSKYIPIEEQDEKIYKIKDFTYGSQELQDKVFTEFYEQKRLIDVKPIPGAIEKINELFDKGNRIILITKRPKNWKEMTEEWLEKVGLKYHKLFFTRKKGKVAKEEKVDVFIDDDIDNIDDVKEKGINTYLFSQPWNEEEEESHVMKDWEEVKASIKEFCKYASPRWTTEEKSRLKKLYLKYRQRGVPHHIIYKACAILLNKSFLSVKQKLESMYDIDEELKPMKFEHWNKEKIDKIIQDLYRNGEPINRLRLPTNLMYQITNHSLPKAKTCGFPVFYPSFDEAIACNILAVGFERENGKLTDKGIETLQDAIKYYRRKEKMTHAWTKDEIISLLQDTHSAGLPLTYSFFKSHPDIYKPLIGVGRSLEGLRDSIKRNGYSWSELVIEAVPEYVEFYTDDGKLRSSTEEMRVRRFMELNNILFKDTSDSDKIKVTDPSLIEMGYKHFLPDFIIVDNDGNIRAIVEVFGSIADSAAANTADIYREKKKAKESFYSTLPYEFISINNNTDGVDLTDEILKIKFATFIGV